MRSMAQPSRTPTDLKPTQYHPTTLSSISKLLEAFIKAKQHDNMGLCLQKLKINNQNKVASSRLTLAILKSLFSRKSRILTELGWIRLLDNMASQKHHQEIRISEQRLKLRLTAAKLTMRIHSRLETAHLKDVFATLKQYGRTRHQMRAYRSRHLENTLVRVFKNRLRDGLDRVNELGVKYFIKKVRLSGIAKLVTNKIKLFELQAFTILRNLNNLNNGESKKKIDETKNNKIVGGPRGNDKASPVGRQSAVRERDDRKQREAEERNKKLKKELEELKQENTKILENYRREIESLEKQHEELKFNNELLDETNRQLEAQLLQRQKKSRKIMSNVDLWQHVYSNFLLFLSTHEAHVVAKELVLQSLETPLAPINVDLDALRMENQILTELLEEYKKFYEGSEPTKQPVEELLPFDVLTSQSKFFYRATEALISQGIGSEEEVKQLESELDSICKHG